MRNAITDAPTKKGGAAVTARPVHRENAMLKIAEPAEINKEPHFFASPEGRAAKWLNQQVQAARGTVTCGVVEITPPLARVMLERNPGNRRVSEVTVDKIVRDIENGTFVLNGESIIVASDGSLNDGQHRLCAVVKANAPVMSVLVFGPPRDTRTTIDQGRSKMVGDYLAMDGHSDSTALAAAAGYVWQWQTRGKISSQAQDRPTKGEVLATVDAHPGIAKSVAGIANKGSVGLGGRGLLGFCHWAFAVNSTAIEATAFIESYTTGAALLSRDPILYARNRIMAEGRRLSPAQKAELIFRAWNAHRRGETPKTMPILEGALPEVER